MLHMLYSGQYHKNCCILSPTAGEDFTTSAEIVTFNPGVVSATVSITILDDDIREEIETFKVQYKMEVCILSIYLNIRIHIGLHAIYIHI